MARAKGDPSAFSFAASDLGERGQEKPREAQQSRFDPNRQYLPAFDIFASPAETCRRFALSLPITALVCGIQSRDNLRQDLAMARSFKPITEQEMERLLAKTEQAGSDGQREPWKTIRYGSRYHREQHGNA
ncbi:MAG: hypothetical protein ACC628_00885 [Pirellulaceae bacterium]